MEESSEARDKHMIDLGKLTRTYLGSPHPAHVPVDLGRFKFEVDLTEVTDSEWNLSYVMGISDASPDAADMLVVRQEYRGGILRDLEREETFNINGLKSGSLDWNFAGFSVVPKDSQLSVDCSVRFGKEIFVNISVVVLRGTSCPGRFRIQKRVAFVQTGELTLDQDVY